MGVVKHSETSRIHKTPDFIYVNQGERLADTSLTSADIYKFAVEADTGFVYMLLSASPNVWKEIAITSQQGATIYDIYTMNDFPAAVSGVRTLPSGKYIIHNALITADRFEIPAGAAVTFTMADQRYNTFEYTGSGVLFTGIGYVQFEISTVQMILSGNNSQLFDLGGGGEILVGSFNFRTGAVRFTGTGCTIGSFRDSAFRVDDMFCDGFSNGMIIEDSSFSLITNTILQGAPGGTPTYVSVLGDITQYFGAENTDIFIESVGHDIFYIEPVIKGIVNIVGCPSATNLGDYFKSGLTGLITSFADISTAPTATTVTDDSGDALFTAIGHGLNIGETAVHTTFAQSSYNGSHVVTAVTANTYKVGLSYVANDTGLFETTTCQVNSTAHGLSNGDAISVFGTINFDAGYRVFNVQTNSFEITLGKAFPGSETTGSWDTSSLNEKSKYVTALNNGFQPNSKNIGSAVVGGNTQATVITTPGQFEDLNLNASMVEAGNIELWKLTNPTTGEMRYDGLVPASLTFGGLVAASSTGGAQRFDFRLLQNGSPLSSPDNIDVPIEINGTIRSSSLLWPIMANPGDLFQIKVANAVGTSNVTIDTLKINIGA